MHHLFTKTRLITLAISSFSLFVFSVILSFVIVPLVIDYEIDKNTMLIRGTEQWHRFKRMPFNITFNATFFEVTNAEDVINKGDDPILKEKGPYIYEEYMERTIKSYNEEKDTISYEKRTSFYFNKTRSGNLSPDDVITLINPGYLIALQMVEQMHLGIMGGTVQKCLNAMFPDKLLMKTTQVKDLIFDGIKVCDFNMKQCNFFGRSICSFFRGTSKTIEEIQNATDHYMMFSFLNYKRREPDGLYEIKTGITNISEVGEITEWEHSNKTKFWPENRKDKTCNIIKGTDGTVFQPHVNEDSKISVFSTDICISAAAEFSGLGSYRGIDGYLYSAGPKLFHSVHENKQDDCFCIQKTKGIDGKDSCFLDGVMDLFPCIGAPVLVSYPHFLYANESYLEGKKGLSPDADKHSLYVLLDKYTGVPLQAHLRAQLSFVVRPLESFKALTSKLPRTVLPVVWIDQGLDLPDEGLDLLNSLLYDTLNLVDIIKWTFMGTTFLLTVISAVLLFMHKYSS